MADKIIEETQAKEASDMLQLAVAMNNLAAALKDSNQLVRDLKIINPQAEDVGLLEAVRELSQRIAILSTRLR
ncbi:MAG: hypothetical protein K0U19_03540 [Proteobacteria bacterium]|nr:hypothetical protein [Pseudomonadota bacterium]